MSDNGSQVLISEDGKLLLLQTDADTKEFLEKLDGAIDIARGCLEIGTFIFPEASAVFLILAGVGTEVQILIHNLPEKPDPVVLRLKELEGVVHEVENQLNSKVAEMKSFITESEFFTHVTSKASVLMKLMRNCLAYQNKDSLKSFKDEYEQKGPLSLAYVMMSFLEQSSTNPLIMAMNSEQEKTKETFEKWETVIKGVFGQLLVIEAFASGFLKSSNPYDWDRLLEQSDEGSNVIDYWREHYGFSKYWEQVRIFMEDFIPKRTDLTNGQKADEIKKHLESYQTNESFIIIVFNQASWKSNYIYECGNEKTQMIACWDKGLCNAIVYRSRTADLLPIAQFDYFENAVKLLPDWRVLYYKENLENVIFQCRDVFRTDGFVCFIEEVKFPEIRFTLSSTLKRAPGSTIKKAVLKDPKQHRPEETKHMIVIAGFP
ncbi:unnamed protein product [Caenorhabditis brenneri]